MRRRSFFSVSGGLLLLPTVVMASQPSVFVDKEVDKEADKDGKGDQDKDTAGGQTLDKFGLQLSTVTSLMLADFEGTLARVAEIGYQQVEFSAMGFLGRSPADMQKLLASLGLEAPVGRVTPMLPAGFFELPRDQAMKIYAERGQAKHLLDNVAHSLQAALALGQRYLVLPALLPDNFQTLDQVKRSIELLNQAGELCARQGVLFGYHNHNWELAAIDDVIPYELMLQQTDPQQVTFQLDAYWIKKGGGELSDYLSRYPGRFSSCHMKDIDANGDFADVGDGLIDFPRFTRQAIAQGARYFFVERDNPPNPAESMQRSFTYLQQMTF